MKEDEKTEYTEADVEKSPMEEKRRSSILKPQKPRNPFSTLDFSEPNPDNTIAKVARRVSFASSNLVKPFAADPEKNTIWDTTYEELVDHTDSTKSSYEQTRDAKSDSLNVTSGYFHEAEEFMEDRKSPPKVRKEDITKYITIDKENVAPILKNKCVVDIENKENIYVGVAMKVSPENSTIFKRGKKCDVSPFNELINHVSKTNFSYMDDSMEMTNIISKENFHPALNNEGRITSPEEKCEKLADFKTNGVRSNNYANLQMVRDNETRGDIRNYKAINHMHDGQQTIMSQSGMELTKTLTVMKIDENMKAKFEGIKNKTVYFPDDNMEFTGKLNLNSKTVYFDESAGDMSVTNILCHNKSNADISLDQEKYSHFELSKEKNLTTKSLVYIDQSVGDMEFTCNLLSKANEICCLPLETGHSYTDPNFMQPTLAANKKIATKENTILFDQSEGDMEFTSTLPHIQEIIAKANVHQKNDVEMSVLSNKKGIVNENCERVFVANSENMKSDRKTIIFNGSGGDLDMTILPESNIKERKMLDEYIEKSNTKPICFSQFDGDMELTNVLHTSTNEINFATQSDKNMENYSKIEDIQPEMDTLPRKEVLPTSTTHIIRHETTNEEYIIENVSCKNDINKSLFKNQKDQMSVLSNHSDTSKILLTKPKINGEKVVHLLQNLNISETELTEEKESCNSVPPKYEDEKLLKKDTVNITGFKRHSNNDDDSNLTIKRKIHSVDQSQLQSEMLNSLTVNKSMHNNTADKNCITEAVLIEESNHTLNNIQNEAHAVIEDVNIDFSKEQRANLQTSPLSNSNILYSEPMKVKLMARSLAPIPDLCDNLNLQSFNSSLNLKLRSSATPATSFHITLSDMSPCVEDTQQLIYATFSKPDQLSLKECLQGHSSVSFNKEKYDFLKTPEKSGGSQHPNSNDGFKGDNQTYECTNSVCKTPKFTNKTCVVEGKVEHTSDTVSLVKSNQKLPQDIKYDHFDINKTANLLFADHPKGENRCNRKNLLPIEDNLKSEKSQFIDDESGADLVLNGSADLDGSNATEQVTETTTTATETGEVKLEQETSMEHESPEDISTRLLDQSSYTLKSQIVLENIDSKCTTHYEIARDNDYTKLVDTIKQSKRNCGLLKDLLNNIRVSSFKVVDLEEKRKQDMEENLSNVSGTSNTSGTNSEEDKGVPSTIGLTAPKSLHGRICEAAERCKKHWRLRKMESDYYYFSTLFGSLPFKVHVHPELGVVYSVQTFTNLEEKSKPICWYELKLFQRKLQNENLLSVLGTKFDIMTLLDYVYMTMEEIIHFHMNYIGLIKKYGVSHHFRMNEDYSISFEIINIRLMLHWLISINMSGLISKESVNAISKLGERVKEEDIKCIAENTPKGINFFAEFINNVDEYIRRLENKFRFRR